MGPSWPRFSDSAALGWVAMEEGGELDEVCAVLAVVVLWVSGCPARAVGGWSFTHHAVPH